ncbi:MAG: M48 family metalloprotease [Myxococcota bacterium]
MNFLKTTALLGLLTGVLLLIGGLVGGRDGLVVMLLVSTALNFGTWFFADTMVLRSTGAQPVPRGELGWLHEDLEDLAKNAGIPKPRLYWTPDPSPNAFATGRSPSKGVVAVTDGLLRTLDRREIRGVLAHEIGHIAHRDTLINAIAASIAGAITWVAYMVMYSRDRDIHPAVRLLVMLLAPISATILRMAISRTREYAADLRAAQISGDPGGLADALEGLARGVHRIPMDEPAAQNVHMIVNGFAGGLSNLMSTHPPIEERIRRLRELQRTR